MRAAVRVERVNGQGLTWPEWVAAAVELGARPFVTAWRLHWASGASPGEYVARQRFEDEHCTHCITRRDDSSAPGCGYCRDYDPAVE